MSQGAPLMRNLGFCPTTVCLCIVHDSLVALAYEVTDPAEGDDGEDFYTCSAPKSQNPKICLWIVRDSPVALAHEVADPAKSNGGNNFHTCNTPFQNLSVHCA